MVINRWIFGIAYFQAHPSCGRLMEHFHGNRSKNSWDISPWYPWIYNFCTSRKSKKTRYYCQKPWFSQQDETTLLGRGFHQGMLLEYDWRTAERFMEITHEIAGGMGWQQWDSHGNFWEHLGRIITGNIYIYKWNIDGDGIYYQESLEEWSLVYFHGG